MKLEHVTEKNKLGFDYKHIITKNKQKRFLINLKG